MEPSLPFARSALGELLSPFGLTFSRVTGFHDTSHGPEDTRWNVVLDDAYVLKIGSSKVIWEERMQQIHRLIQRYHTIGVYCPRLIPTKSGSICSAFETAENRFVCYVEEFARYPVCQEDSILDWSEVTAHLGVLAARYSGVDLSDNLSMWSLIDLSPLDTDVDEKQENADSLVECLQEAGYPELARSVNEYNTALRAALLPRFRELPRCVYQGDMNYTNVLVDNGHFAGLIDFNLSGTEVNINCFLCETQWFPETADFDAHTISELLSMIDSKQAVALDVILQAYSLNELEKQLLPYYKGIITLFQWPHVCQLITWLGDDSRKEKAAELIRGLIQ